MAGTVLTQPGVHHLRTNVIDRDQETQWGACTMPTDPDSVFRSLKPELGLRPLPPGQVRTNGHPFITVLACQLVQTIRRRFREHGETSSRATLCRTQAGKQRVTATFRCKEGRILHLRKATLVEPDPSQSWMKTVPSWTLTG